MASGDSHPGDNTLGTFNPLFPNGYYFTLAGYTGYVNLIHIKPSITVKPTDKLTLTSAIGLQWRQTTADAIYVQPNQPLPETAGKGGAWSGAYVSLGWTMLSRPTSAVPSKRFTTRSAALSVTPAATTAINSAYNSLLLGDPSAAAPSLRTEDRMKLNLPII